MVRNLFRAAYMSVCRTPHGGGLAICTAFEDNNGAIEIANMPKMRTHTKHINLVYHHFREHVIQKKIIIKPIDTSFQIADIFTQSFYFENCLRHRT